MVYYHYLVVKLHFLPHLISKRDEIKCFLLKKKQWDPRSLLDTTVFSPPEPNILAKIRKKSDFSG